MPSATPDDVRTIHLIATVMRDAGGAGMELTGRQMGGARIRFWMPSERAANPCVELARRRRWFARSMPHYATAGALRADGVQVVIDLPIPAQALTLPEPSPALGYASTIVSSTTGVDPSSGSVTSP